MRLTGSLDRNGVSPVLHQNVDDLPFLINGTSQVLELTAPELLTRFRSGGKVRLPKERLC